MKGEKINKLSGKNNESIPEFTWGQSGELIKIHQSYKIPKDEVPSLFIFKK